MPSSFDLTNNNAHLELAAKLLWVGVRSGDVPTVATRALAALSAELRLEYAVLFQMEYGNWQTVAEAGTRAAVPLGLLADALDRGDVTTRDNWYAVGVPGTESTQLLLAVRPTARPHQDRPGDDLRLCAGVLGEMLTSARERERTRRERDRLEAILEASRQWNRLHEMEPLLQQIAESATRLLHADRASIFLWDKANRVLVGRPALGVEGGELRIPDDQGVVGQVLKTGQPIRVDLAQGQDQINRRVDRQLGYRTQTLLCVPLRFRGGDRLGAFEVINKRDGNFTPEDEFALSELASHAAVALENTQDREKLLESRRLISEQAAQTVRLIGESPAISALRSTIARVAPTDLHVLVLGENGTGKEVVSQMIHYLSQRRDQPFIAVNCAAISETLLESELFGHEKGAFTDAHQSRPGKFELANGGTLFLDEIGDLSLAGQSKLLRVLEEKVIVRVGGSQPIHTDARVIAATNQHLADMVRQRKFREDLFYRLNVVTLELPALRDRSNDVLLLAEHFLNAFSMAAKRRPLRLSPEARRRLQEHPWPGNVRELRNLMERLAYLLNEETVQAEDLAFIKPTRETTLAGLPMDLVLSEATDRFQCEYIKDGIRRANNNMSLAAQRLGLHRSNLYRKMKQLGMQVADDADSG